MESIQTPNQCQHPGCKCPRPTIGDYCSDHCENAHQDGMDNDCQCGHPECN
jgi:hypothetical protein